MKITYKDYEIELNGGWFKIVVNEKKSFQCHNLHDLINHLVERGGEEELTIQEYYDKYREILKDIKNES